MMNVEYAKLSIPEKERINIYGNSKGKRKTSPQSTFLKVRVDSHCREILLVYARLYYYIMRNFCNLVGVEQWYFSLIRNTYM